MNSYVHTHSAGVATTWIFAPGNWEMTLSENACAASGTASHTTNCELPLLSTSEREQRLYAISEPIRPRPMNAVVCARWGPPWANCENNLAVTLMALALYLRQRVNFSGLHMPSSRTYLDNRLLFGKIVDETEKVRRKLDRVTSSSSLPARSK